MGAVLEPRSQMTKRDKRKMAVGRKDEIGEQEKFVVFRWRSNDGYLCMLTRVNLFRSSHCVDMRDHLAFAVLPKYLGEYL